MSSDTKDRMIKAAHDLFYERGFHAVGLDTILQQVNVTKTTFYNHFDSKEDLISEVLRWHDRWWQDTFREMLRRHGGDDPRDQLLGIFDALAEMFGWDQYNGCFFVNVAVQFPLPHDPAHQAAAFHKQSMERIIRELAGYAHAGNPEALAKELSLIMEGAYVTQHISRDPETVAIARRLGEMVIHRHLPQTRQTETH